MPSLNPGGRSCRCVPIDRVPGRQRAAYGPGHLPGDRRTREIVERYAAAFEQDDMDSLVSMLTEDASRSMPPVPAWFRGREAIREFPSRARRRSV